MDKQTFNPVVQKFIFPFVLIGLGALGAMVIFHTNPWGLGFIDWDSFSYVSVARSLAKGLGYVYPKDPDTLAPLSSFPPGLPTFLALFQLFGIDAIPAARILNSVLFGLSAILVGITIQKINRSPLFSLFGAFLFVISPRLIFYHSFLLAESLYIFFTLFAFLFLITYLQSGKTYQLIILGVLLACTSLVRFVGITNVITAVFILLIVRNKSKLPKLVETAIVLIISVVPLLLWMNRPLDSVEAGQPSGIRTPGLERMFQADYLYIALSVFHTLYMYFLPENVVVGFEKEHLLL